MNYDWVAAEEDWEGNHRSGVFNLVKYAIVEIFASIKFYTMINCKADLQKTNK